MHTNPLSQFFRQPAIYIRLPSRGQGWPAGSLDVPPDSELPVYPMTAIDEITYRTPDALFNGESTVSVIQSCVPNIKNAWAVPSTDLDTILVAIRIASYGHGMDMDTVCPKCKEEATFELDLRSIIDKIKSADYNMPLVIGDLSVYFRPLDYRQITDNNLIQFEQQKTMQIMGNADAPEEAKVSQLNKMMKTMMEATVNVLSQSISEIRTGSAIVQDPNQISEFMHKCDRNIFNQIKDHAVKLRESSELRPLKMRCRSCQNEYEQVFTMDMTRFFGRDS